MLLLQITTSDGTVTEETGTANSGTIYASSDSITVRLITDMITQDAETSIGALLYYSRGMNMCLLPVLYIDMCSAKCQWKSPTGITHNNGLYRAHRCKRQIS